MPNLVFTVFITAMAFGLFTWFHEGDDAECKPAVQVEKPLHIGFTLG